MLIIFRAKYPLAVVEALFDAFGSGLGVGYDIGCKFKTTLANSELGQRAQSLRYTSLVGSFHGHAHNRLCQLSHLALYAKGIGLEDLEGCERFFSKSNALAGSTRHASVFHRRQQIVEYLKHTDATETSQNLSTYFSVSVKIVLMYYKANFLSRITAKLLTSLTENPTLNVGWK